MAILRAAATAADTLDATSPTLINGLTLTPAADDYLLFATVEVETATSGGTENNTFGVFVGGSEISIARRDIQEETSLDLDRITVAINCKVSPDGAEDVEVRHAATGSGTPMTAYRRELNLFPMPDTGTEYEGGTITDDTLATATWTTLDSMDITPDAGDYLLLFSCSFEGPSDVDLGFRVEVDGTAIAHTVRQGANENSLPDTSRPLMIACEVSPAGSEVVEIAWSRVDGSGTITCHDRVINLIPVDSGDIVEASGTANDTRSATGETLIDDMTITDPGDNDWLVCFSSWDTVGTVGNEIETTYMIYEGGAKVTDSDRRNDHEGSLDSTALPVLAGGRVTIEGATDDLEMYWDNSVTDTWTLHERTLVAIREFVAPVSTFPYHVFKEKKRDMRTLINL